MEVPLSLAPSSSIRNYDEMRLISIVTRKYLFKFYLCNIRVFPFVPILVTGYQIVETGQNICDITVGGAHVADTN